MRKQGDRVFLDIEEAEAMLPDGDRINVKLSQFGALIGSDWKRADVLELLADGTPELSGAVATGMGFGMAVLRQGRYHFVETKQAQS